MATINYDHHLLVADYCLCRVDTGSGWCVIFLHSSKKLTELLTLPRGVCCCCNLRWSLMLLVILSAWMIVMFLTEVCC